MREQVFCRYPTTRSQRSEVRSQRSEVRGPRSEVRGQKPATRNAQQVYPPKLLFSVGGQPETRNQQPRLRQGSGGQAATRNQQPPLYPQPTKPSTQKDKNAKNGNGIFAGSVLKISLFKNKIATQWNSDTHTGSVFRNMTKLATGTGLAKLIGYLTTSVKTRIYLSEHFGVVQVLNIFNSISFQKAICD